MMPRLLSAAVAACILALVCQGARAEDKATVALDWVINGTHAGFFVAREKGLYRAAGIDVTISRGFGSGDTVKRVATGNAQFGVADTGAILVARANEDVPVRIVGMLYDRSSLGLIYLAQSGIKSPKDLEGRALGRSASGASVNMLPGFLKANDIDRTKLREVVVDGATFLPLLMSGQVDAVTEQAVNIGKFRKAASERGKEARAMRFSDYGLESYGNALIISTDTLGGKPDLVGRFVEATLKGTAYALENPAEAIALLRQFNPEVNAEGATDELLALKDIESTPDVRQHGLGFMDAHKMEATRETVTTALGLKRIVPLDTLYTTQFLPKTPVLLFPK